LATFAVPFFMMITGYFFFNDLPTDKAAQILRLKRYEKNLCVIWLFWMIVYIPNMMLTLKGESLSVIVAKALRGFVGISPNYLGSWYLPATMFGLWFCYQFVAKMRFKLLAISAVLTYVLAALASVYSKVVSSDDLIGKIITFVRPKNFLEIGIIWIALAVYFVYHQETLKKAFKPWWVVLSGGLLFLEHLVMTHFHVAYMTGLYVTLILFSLSLFVMMFKVKLSFSEATCDKLRNLSTLMFFLQFYAIAVVARFTQFGIQRFLAAIFIIVIIAFTIMKLSTYKLFKWLKWGY
jgi:surface polysaccharide O-acyltransferase-like enzyme